MDRKRQAKALGTVFWFVTANLVISHFCRELPLRARVLTGATIGITLHYIWSAIVDSYWERHRRSR
jgi:hypothetical protein